MRSGDRERGRVTSCISPLSGGACAGRKIADKVVKSKVKVFHSFRMLIIVHACFKTLTLRYSARFKISYFELNAACILSYELASSQSPMHTRVHVNKHKTKTKQLGNIRYVEISMEGEERKS